MNAYLEHEPLSCPGHSDRRSRTASPLIRHDLCAQIAPLDRYGPAGLGEALADGVIALVSASKTALSAAGRCAEA
jgi:hypothetical protein